MPQIIEPHRPLGMSHLRVEHAEMGPTVYGLHPQTDSPRLIEGSLQTENG
jgi:hypothetical protein